MRDRKWLKEASWSLPRSLILLTDSAGGDERVDVRDHGEPPKVLSHKDQGLMGNQVAGKPGGQDSSHSYIRSVGLHHKLTGQVRMDYGEVVVKQCLRSRNTRSAAGDHLNGNLGEVSAERGEARVL